MKNAEEISDINKSFKRVKEVINKAHYESATKIINKLYDKSLKINYTKGVNLYYENFILILYNTQKDNLALTFLDYLIKVDKRNNNKKRLAKMLLIKGVILSRLNNFQDSFYYINKALSIFKESKNKNHKEIVRAYLSLAFNSVNKNKQKKAQEYVDKGIAYLANETNLNEESIEFLYLMIFKVQISLSLNKRKLAKKLYSKYLENKLLNKKENSYIREIEINLLLIENDKKKDKLIVGLIESCLKVSFEIQDKTQTVRLLNLMKEFYSKRRKFRLAYKYANRLIKFNENIKERQIPTDKMHFNSKNLSVSDKNEESFEIYHKSELQLAAKYQKRFQYKKLLSNKVTIKTIFKPFNSLSGDYIGTFNLCNDDFYHLYILADVVGKGITASYISFMLNGIIKSILYNSDSYSLKKIIKDINSILSDSLENKGFVSLWAGIVDLRNNTLESINAGHSTTYLLKKNEEIVELNNGCTILGMFSDLPELDSEFVAFDEGDSIISYSDGVTEAMDSNAVLFENKFHALINKYSENKNFDFIDTLEKEILTHQDNSQIQDDVSCLLVEYKPKS